MKRTVALAAIMTCGCAPQVNVNNLEPVLPPVTTDSQQDQVMVYDTTTLDLNDAMKGLLETECLNNPDMNQSARSVEYFAKYQPDGELIRKAQEECKRIYISTEGMAKHLKYVQENERRLEAIIKAYETEEFIKSGIYRNTGSVCAKIIGMKSLDVWRYEITCIARLGDNETQRYVYNIHLLTAWRKY